MSEHKNPVPTVDIILQKGSDILLIKGRTSHSEITLHFLAVL